MRPLAGKVALVTGFISILLKLIYLIFHNLNTDLHKEQQGESEKVISIIRTFL
jgi:hypothetical protein